MSLSGMTGFGRAEGAAGDWSWAVEARSVNGRNLEVRFRGPPGFERIERASREAAQKRFQRGQVNVSVQARRAEGAGLVRVNSEALERYLELGRKLVEAGRAGPPSVDGLLSLRGVIEADSGADDPDVLAAVEEAMIASVEAAMSGLEGMRRQEGAALAEVLGGLVDRIGVLVGEAAAHAEAQPSILRDRFRRRLSELAGEAASEERILQEASVLAVKADVREELDRLSSHVEAARALILANAAVGRKLDFLTQEFMREANTLCSKSALGALTAVGLDLKAVIEQFREQVQNVE